MTDEAAPDRLRQLPSVSVVLDDERLQVAVADLGHAEVAAAVRAAQAAARRRVRAGDQPPDAAGLAAAALAALDADRESRLHAVINATGVLLHTNLGRAPLAAEAQRAIVEAAGATALEYDLATGRRGRRTGALGAQLARLTGAEAATVVNNGAAAVLLVLTALAAGREVVVSRGELIEIGGSFRLPEVMQLSGATLREVGTTNRTRVADHRAAITDDTGLLLKVHRSNFEVTGFVEDPPLDALAGVAHQAGVPLVFDLGSGLLEADPHGPLCDEPDIAGALAAGCDVVIVSGDKLLGGPQAGIVAGRAELVAACERHPLFRALRIDKLQRAALEATLDLHLQGRAADDVPVARMLSVTPEELRARATAVAAQVPADRADIEVVELTAVVGGGTSPRARLASAGLALSGVPAEPLAQALRTGQPGVVARIERDAVVLDLRTVAPEQDRTLAQAVAAALSADDHQLSQDR